MHYKVKNFSIKKDALWVTAAANNVRPLTFYREQYDKNEPDIRKKLASFAVSIMEGNFQPYNTCGHRDWWMKCQEMHTVCGINFSSWDKDRLYNTNRYYEIIKFSAEKVMVPLFFNETVPESIYQKIRDFEEESKRIYQETQERYDRERKIAIRSAWRCDALGDVDLLMTDQERYLLAKAKHYNNRGLLDDGDCSAVDITAEPELVRAVIRGTFDETQKTRVEELKSIYSAA